MEGSYSKIQISPHEVIISWHAGVDLVELLQIIYYYDNLNRGNLYNIILGVENKGTMWFNDITSFKHKHLLFLHLHLKQIIPPVRGLDSDIGESDLKKQTMLILKTITAHNEHPVIEERSCFLKKMFEDWITQL